MVGAVLAAGASGIAGAGADVAGAGIAGASAGTVGAGAVGIAGGSGIGGASCAIAIVAAAKLTGANAKPIKCRILIIFSIRYAIQYVGRGVSPLMDAA
jgi:hypothetical protein